MPKAPLPYRFRLPRAAALAVAALLIAYAAVLIPDTEAVTAQETESLIAYEMVDQWPVRDSAAEGLFQTPNDLVFTRDGTVFIADAGIGGVHRLLPTGVFSTPFGVTGGFPQQLGRVGKLAIGPDPSVPGFPFSAERVYVLDPAVERVVFYRPDGSYAGQWEDINGEGIAATMDGRVYVFDREESNVIVLNAFTGDELFRIGERGLDDGQFSNFTDLDVSPDGRVLAVGDKRGARVQLFDLATAEDLAGETPPPPFSPRRSYDLLNPRYTQGDNSCRATRMNAMGGDKVFIGQAAQACILDGRDYEFAIAASANSRAICKDTVTLPRLNAMTQSYYALADNDPNTGRCGEKRTELDTTPVIVKYGDESLKSIETIWEAASNENSDNPLLFSPNRITMPSPDNIFVSDSSSQLRYFDLEGQQIATSERRSSTGGGGGDFEFFNVIQSSGGDVLGEIYGYYLRGQRSGGQFTVEAGIGRFQNVERRTQQGTETVIEPVWTDQLASSFQDIEVPALGWNHVTKELLVVRVNVIEQQRTQDVQIVRYDENGREIKPAFDLPDDGSSNPYTDLKVGADGRIFALDDFADLVRIMAPDGTMLTDVPVAFDARRVAGGPDTAEGSVYVLREPGSIERYADDGTITARLDGRPLAFSDPTTLSDITVDGSGRVYVSDAQSSLISVFNPSSDRLNLPVPAEGACAFVGDTTADPTSFDLGATAAISISMLGKCGIFEEPADIVVTVPYFGRLQQGVDPARTLITEMKQLVSRVNFDKHRVGIVSFFSTTTLDLALTNDREAYFEATEDITRFNPPNENVKQRLKDGMEEAFKLYDDDSRRKVLVILNADYCNPESEFFPGQCQGYPPAEETALAMRQAGVTIIVINSFGAFDLASSDEDAFFGSAEAHRRMVRYEPPIDLAEDVTLTYGVPSDIAVDESTITGTGAGAYATPNVTWTQSEMGFGGGSFGLTIEPLTGGTMPVADSIVASFRDGWGQDQQLSFPIPEIEVIPPPETPVPPTATPVPATATPEPTATPETVSLFLPWVGNNECFPVKRRFDIALVVDVSSSMAEGEGEKIAAAKASMRAFVENTDLSRNRDRVTIIDFATEAKVEIGLSGDRAALEAAIDGIETRFGTRIDRGLDEAVAELERNGRDNAGQVIVLLSDGQQIEEPDTAYAAGEAARDAGITVFAVGLGEGADATLLQDVAGEAGRYYFAPDAGALAGIYGQVQASIPGCP
jgi:DNA-binding beta-propeller fold protein YncE/uncharacterized protein YegL